MSGKLNMKSQFYLLEKVVYLNLDKTDVSLANEPMQ